MKKLIMNIALIAAVTFSFQSCYVRINSSYNGNVIKVDKDANAVTRIDSLSAFSSLNVIGSLDVRYIQEDVAPYAEIKSKEPVIDLIKTRVDNGILTIDFDSYKTMIIGNYYLEITVHGPSLKELHLAGSGDLTADSLVCEKIDISLIGSGDLTVKKLVCPTVEASVAGSGDLTLKGIRSESLIASVAGSGDITLIGHARSASLSVAGSGDIDAESLMTETPPEKNVKGSGDIECQ